MEDPRMSSNTILSNLNSSQRAAVSSSAQTLAILAGPGSGKTHTLTSRTAWLLVHEGLQPWNIIIATFTVKAAREMKERVGKLIGDGLESKLILGTFHSIARRYLARYGHLIDIPRNFGIADSSDSLAIIKRIIKRHNLTIDASAARSRISSRKAKGGETHPFDNGNERTSKSHDVQEFQTCYVKYEEALKRSNLLDYDDLLLKCVDLLRAYPSCVSNVEAVLIDEFQDTNLVQFDLMRLFASQRRRVTIVGDPDQSIYGFRSAETKNFRRMLKQYPETVMIPLEENYRSSGAIILTALEIIQQDGGRIAKPLMPTHSVGTRPVLRTLSSSHVEARWLVDEIQRCITLTGDLLSFNDFAILLRSASLSRQIESSLGKAGIAYRMVGGHRFFDRVEVKILLDYLRVIYQTDNNDAVARVANIPPRHVGDMTMKSLLEEAEQSSMSLWMLILQHIQGVKRAKVKITNKTEQGLSSFVNLILKAKKFFEHEGHHSSIADLIGHIISKISFENFLRKTYPDDYESRWANIEELMNQALDFTNVMSTDLKDDESLPKVDGLEQDNDFNPLTKFLANIALASDVKSEEISSSVAQVTISTIHAAKGLEWPVVFIPAVYEGSIPHSRSEDADEERRLLYVAMTRAQALLYMSYPKSNSRGDQTTLSQYLKPSSLKPYLEDKGPSFSSHVTQSIAQILHRPLPKVKFELLQNRDSLEDDQFPLDGSIVTGQNHRAVEVEGADQYQFGQLRPKRRRVGKADEECPPRELWQSSYTTTMDQVTSLSTVSTPITYGFISAVSHLKELNRNLTNSVTVNETYITAALPSGTHNHTKVGLSKKKPGISARTTQRSEGQKTISGFLLKPMTQKPLSSLPENVRTAHQLGNLPQPVYEPVRKQTRPTSLSEPAIEIPSLLASRRLKPAVLPTPVQPYHEGENRKRKPYGPIWSSSPPHKDDERRPDSKLLTATVDTIGRNSIRSDTMSITLQTMHKTTMDQKKTAQITKRTYGVKREMKPWSSQGLKPFKPPSIIRPS